jgi:hypothetical protein
MKRQDRKTGWCVHSTGGTPMMRRLDRFSSRTSDFEDFVSPERDTHKIRTAALMMVPALILGSALSALIGMA